MAWGQDSLNWMISHSHIWIILNILLLIFLSKQYESIKKLTAAVAVAPVQPGSASDSANAAARLSTCWRLIHSSLHLRQGQPQCDRGAIGGEVDEAHEDEPANVVLPGRHLLRRQTSALITHTGWWGVIHQGRVWSRSLLPHEQGESAVRATHREVRDGLSLWTVPHPHRSGSLLSRQPQCLHLCTRKKFTKPPWKWSPYRSKYIDGASFTRQDPRITRGAELLSWFAICVAGQVIWSSGEQDLCGVVLQGSAETQLGEFRSFQPPLRQPAAHQGWKESITWRSIQIPWTTPWRPMVEGLLQFTCRATNSQCQWSWGLHACKVDAATQLDKYHG